MHIPWLHMNMCHRRTCWTFVSPDCSLRQVRRSVCLPVCHLHVDMQEPAVLPTWATCQTCNGVRNICMNVVQLSQQPFDSVLVAIPDYVHVIQLFYTTDAGQLCKTPNAQETQLFQNPQFIIVRSHWAVQFMFLIWHHRKQPASLCVCVKDPTSCQKKH